MSMFATSAPSSFLSTRVDDEIKAWERALSLRISLQKVMDAANKLSYIPDNLQSSVGLNEVQEKSQELLSGAHNLLASQVDPSESKSKKRKLLSGNAEEDWEAISQVQDALQPRWEESINKWHSRLNFGSFEATSKMKTFKQTLWEQVSGSLGDKNRVIEKSRLTFDDAKKLVGDVDTFDSFAGRFVETADGKKYDVLVYDDRQFYSMLLKTFISQNAAGSAASNLAGEDMAALRQFKKSKSDVDRKASKGRRIRYTVHTKLQSYMFPMSTADVDPNTDRLLQSLFQ